MTWLTLTKKDGTTVSVKRKGKSITVDINSAEHTAKQQRKIHEWRRRVAEQLRKNTGDLTVQLATAPLGALIDVRLKDRPGSLQYRAIDDPVGGARGWTLHYNSGGLEPENPDTWTGSVALREKLDAWRPAGEPMWNAVSPFKAPEFTEDMLDDDYVHPAE